MMVRRASITYRESNSSTLPGFLGEPRFLGQQSLDGHSAPGYLYTFGIQEKGFVQKLDDNNKFYKDANIVTPIGIAYTSDLDLKANIEPIPGLKIDLNAKRYEAKNTSVLLVNNSPTTFTGSYNITQIAIENPFMNNKKNQTNYYSESFNTFKNYSKIIANRLNSSINIRNTKLINPDSLQMYTYKSADVLIPAFLAAYTHKDPNKIDTNPFLSLFNILPNWRMSYDGFSRLEWIKEKFKTVSITHAYTCKYGVGSYTSFASWTAFEDNTALGFVREQADNLPLISLPYSIQSVNLSEQFSPLLGINAVLKNSITLKGEYRKQRNLTLNITNVQMIESTSDEYIIGGGYILKDFNLILKLKSNKQTQVKNDLKLSVDLSWKDIKTLMRKIDESLIQPQTGNKVLSCKMMADYVFSSKVNFQLFFDYQSNTPLISSSFPISTTNFGISLKFMLTR